MSREERRRLLRHVAGCSFCADRLARLQLDPTAPPDRLSEASWDRLRELVRTEEAAHRRRRRRAARFEAELMAQAPEARRGVLEEAEPTFELAEHLLEKALEGRFGPPAESAHLLDMASEVAARLEPSEVPGSRLPASLIPDLKARIAAHRANTERIAGRFQSAEDLFREARHHLAQGTQEPLVAAEVLDLMASLRNDQRRFSEALALLDRVRELHTKMGFANGAAKALVMSGLFAGNSGDVPRAFRCLEQALDLLDPVTAPDLALAATHNLAMFLCDEDPLLALAVMERARPIYETVNQGTAALRSQWLLGRIFSALGDRRRSLEIFGELADRFAAIGIPFDAALVLLELATVLADLRAWPAVYEVAGHALALFQSLGIRREATAALRLLQDAIEGQTLDRELLRQVSQSLSQAR